MAFSQVTMVGVLDLVSLTRHTVASRRRRRWFLVLQRRSVARSVAKIAWLLGPFRISLHPELGPIRRGLRPHSRHSGQPNPGMLVVGGHHCDDVRSGRGAGCW